MKIFIVTLSEYVVFVTQLVTASHLLRVQSFPISRSSEVLDRRFPASLALLYQLSLWLTQACQLRQDYRIFGKSFEVGFHTFYQELCLSRWSLSPQLWRRTISIISDKWGVRWQILVHVMHCYLQCVEAPRGKCVRIFEGMIFGRWEYRWGPDHLRRENSSVENFERDKDWWNWIRNSYKPTCN